MGKHAQSSTVQSSIQYGAEGSVLRNVPSKPHPAERLLKQAVWWIDAAHESAGSQTITNLGWGGSALNATAGSSGSADSNDPLFLNWDGDNYAYLPGVSGNYLSVPDEAALDITGDIDVRVRVALDDWTPSGSQVLAAKWVTSGNQRSWILMLETNGVLGVYLSADGVGQVAKGSTLATGLADGSVKWVRAVVDVDNGASGYDVKFYLGDDGATWTQLGSTVTTATATSIYSSSAPVEIGGYNSATGSVAAGRFYRAIVKNGIDGPTVLDIDTSLISSGSATSFSARTGQTVTINRSTSGRKAVAVTQPVWLFGTDDYLQVAHSTLLNYGNSDSFSVVAVTREWPTTLQYRNLVSKRDGSYYGWQLATEVTAVYRHIFNTSNATNVFNTATTPHYDPGAVVVTTGVRNGTMKELRAYINTTLGTTVTEAAGWSTTNTSAVNIGGNGDLEMIAGAVFPRALTASEISLLNDYYQGRD